MLRTDGRDVVADVAFNTGSPNTGYEVRIIQSPRTSAQGCGAGDPGVASASFVTDQGGAGGVTVRGPIAPGATKAWLFLSRPSAFAQQPEEFYTTDVAAGV